MTTRGTGRIGMARIGGTGGLGEQAQPEQVKIPVSVLTSEFQVRGELRILGMLQTWFNDEQKPTLIVNDAEVLGVQADNPAARMKQAEIRGEGGRQSAAARTLDGVPRGSDAPHAGCGLRPDRRGLGEGPRPGGFLSAARRRARPDDLADRAQDPPPGPPCRGSSRRMKP